MNQERRQELSRQKIFEAAREEFGSNDYEKVTMESICTGHNISKGRMYHYYSNKDELFLLCVEDTVRTLKEYLEQDMQTLDTKDALECLKHFFMVREVFFRQHPKEKRIFENAMFYPPEPLIQKVQKLCHPIEEVNRDFFEKMIGKMPLRAEVDKLQAIRCLERAEFMFRIEIRNRYDGRELDWNDVTRTAQEMLDMALFGVVRQQEN